MKKLLALVIVLGAFAALAVTTPANVTGSNISDVLAEVVHGTVSASKALIVDTNKDLATLRHLTISGNLVSGSTTINETELGWLDTVTTAGTVVASKAVVVDANKRVDDLDVTALEIGNVDITADGNEINLIDGSVAGTAVASKVLSLGANKNVDTLAIADGGLKLGAGAGTAVGATAAELNSQADVSAYTQAIIASGAITADGSKRHITLDGAQIGAAAITLAAPSAADVGHVLTIQYLTGSTNNVTLALTNVIGGSAATTATFNAVDETLVLIATTTKWVVLKEVGVTLS